MLACGVVPGLDVHDDEGLGELGLLSTALLGRRNQRVLLLLCLLLLLRSEHQTSSLCIDACDVQLLAHSAKSDHASPDAR